MSSTRALRERLGERVRLPVHEVELEKDTLHLAAALGRVLAQADASPTLAATALDPFLDGCSSRHQASLRAALFESYSSFRLEAVKHEDARAWEFPHCAVPLGDGRYAVCASLPVTDPEEISEWADRVAAALVRAGAKRVHLSGTGRPQTALVDALELVGVPHSSADASGPTPQRHGFRFPWRK